MQPNEPLETLATTGILKREPPVPDEINGLIRSAAARLADAQKTSNSPESRFDLAYNAAHALALAALRFHGYRSEKRYIVFQALPHTLGVAASTWRLLDRCHRERNATEYEGLGDIDQKRGARRRRAGVARPRPQIDRRFAGLKRIRAWRGLNSLQC